MKQLRENRKLKNVLPNYRLFKILSRACRFDYKHRLHACLLRDDLKGYQWLDLPMLHAVNILVCCFKNSNSKFVNFLRKAFSPVVHYPP